MLIYKTVSISFISLKWIYKSVYPTLSVFFNQFKTLDFAHVSRTDENTIILSFSKFSFDGRSTYNIPYFYEIKVEKFKKNQNVFERYTISVIQDEYPYPS